MRALNILAPSMCTFTFLASASFLMAFRSSSYHTLPLKVPFSRKMRSVLGKVICSSSFRILFSTN
jgi:hypothetical protein